MKKITHTLAILFFILPSVSSAAALTQQQSNSLIAVVQSSPGTPASAFVSLITAFSNITTAQASSLIAVVQAAPGVPANAFVNLLTSFTVDIPTTSTTNQTMNPTTGVSPGNEANLSISLGQVTVSSKSITVAPSVYLSWTTNLPATSKVFLTKTSVGAVVPSTQIISSAAGISTQGFVNIQNLSRNTEYSYTIEAIASTQVQKISGVINTTPPAVVCSQPVITLNLSTTSLSVYPFKAPYPDGNYDVPVKASVQIYSNCGFDPMTMITLDATTDSAKAYDPSQLNGSSSGAFGKVEEINKYHNFSSTISDDGTTISFTAPVNIRTFVAGTQYISVGLGGKQVQVTEVNVQ